MKYIICAIIIIACVADKLRDKFSSHPKWRKRYKFPKWIPRKLWMKVQDRWHIAKQFGFALPLAMLDYLVYHVYGDWILALAMIPVAAIAWSYIIKDPEHWGK